VSAAADGNANMADNAGTGDNTQGREKRSRDRYGRERGPRGERNERGERADRGERQDHAALNGQQALDGFAEAAPAASAPENVAEALAKPAQIATENVAIAAALAPAAPAANTGVDAKQAGLPKVQAFTLPVASLVEVAQGSGLSWVNSNPERIQAVQAAIAAEPKPIHVPRERPAPVQIDTGPLILVETKKDLANLALPFETNQPQP
jgi:ribonuclease E